MFFFFDTLQFFFAICTAGKLNYILVELVQVIINPESQFLCMQLQYVAAWILIVI